MMADSEWGHAFAMLADPTPAADSKWGFTSATLRRPHHPVNVLTLSGGRHVPILSWDGTDWR